MITTPSLLKKIIGQAGIVEKRWGSAEVWTAENPVLHEGELGLEVALGLVRAKLGDGVNRWNSLPYVNAAGTPGDVSGPASSVDNRVVFFSGTTGKVIKDSGITLSGSNTGDQTLAGLGGQPLDATLTALSGADWSLNAIPIGTGADAVAQVAFGANTFPARASAGNLVAKPITDFGLSLVDDADAAAARTTLNLGNVENTALSTWAGSANITTLGAVATGTWDATAIALGKGGTGAALVDPNADRIMFWDDSTGAVTWLTVGTTLAITGTTLDSVAARVQAVVSAATVTPAADSDDVVTITAQAEALTLANPSGTPTQGQKLIVRIKDNATARAISYGTQYRAMGNTLPTTTVVSKTVYLGLIYNSTDTKWDLVAVAQEA